jgi:hypothetical protein
MMMIPSTANSAPYQHQLFVGIDIAATTATAAAISAPLPLSAAKPLSKPFTFDQ